ncbi:MFS transporter [Virgibacillus sp. NKC19-16]|uniref:MFS transporter n=1 Tax=Virgibacillus salidurans TaxID=2831673 RepID=UPI001F33CF48|nr:MFS transporter [Virgibacillus sp. NKC19-16]UJL46194.1 MFS transporter [Virgibacillus sp. NKC19-16]
MKSKLANWKEPIFLLTSVGIAGIGDFIYLVAINILVFQMTGSAAAVAGLWIIGPAVNILTKFWTGSFIDYRSKRKIMIVTYLARAIFIFLIPFAPNIGFVYLILIFLSIAKAFFTPSSTTYITQLIPRHMRKRYNSVQSFTTSGAFIIGPAIGGTLILMSSVTTTLLINGVSFILAAFLLYILPEKDTYDKNAIPKLTISQIVTDVKVVLTFIKKHKYVALLYVAFLATAIFTFAMDAQEVVFAQQVVGLTEVDYSLLISITGIGSIAGALLISVFSQKFSLRYMIAIGILMQTVGYILYAFSWSFLSIAFGFTILGFFNVFLNAGIMTFYQNNVPTALMGRVTSIFQLLQSLFQIIFVLGVGVISDIIPLRITIITLSFEMLMLAVVMVVFIFLPGKRVYFREG